MSAARHLQEADKERAVARAHLDAYRPGAARAAVVPAREGPNVPTFYPLIFYNPTQWHLDEATAHGAHARQHEAAARALESFEAEECAGFPPESRVACPILAGVLELRDLPFGVRLRFADDVPLRAVVAHMRCHYASARAHGFDQAAGCPLYIKGIHIELTGGTTIEITADDDLTAREIRRRARAEVAPGRRPTTL